MFGAKQGEVIRILTDAQKIVIADSNSLKNGLRLNLEENK